MLRLAETKKSFSGNCPKLFKKTQIFEGKTEKK